MSRCRVDKSIERVVVEGFDFPLGVYPVEPMSPKEGYTLSFEAEDAAAEEGVDRGEAGGAGGSGGAGGARERGEGGDAGEGPDGAEATFDLGGGGEFGGDGAGEGADEDDEDGGRGPSGRGGEDLAPGAEGERWPDRYVWDIVVKASRLESLLRMLMTLLPGRVYPIVDVLGNDAYREIDPYVAYDLVGQERFFDVLRRFRGFFLEDGMVGFGAMSDEPFVYVFVDEHKIVTVRAETRLKERVERILAAFELKQVESLAGADAAPHEHRTVLDAPGDRPDLLTSDEVLEAVRDEWGLTLNVNPERNLDDRGRPLGICPWRCVVRMIDEKGDVRYREMLLSAGNLVDAEGLAMEDTISGAEAEPPAPGGSGSGRRTPVRGRRPGLTGSGSGSGEGAEATEEKEQGEKKEGEAAGPEGGGDEEPRALDLIVADRLRKEDFRKALSTAAAGEPAAGAVKKGQRVDSGLVERALKLDQARVWAARWLA